MNDQAHKEPVNAFIVCWWSCCPTVRWFFRPNA